jgi:hypothetical protein
VTVEVGTISEFGGANVGTVRRPNTDNANALVVTLASSDVSEVSVPLTVTIPAGAASATFPINAVDDNLLDGLQTASILATASGYVSGSASLTIADYETLAISIVPQSISELNGTTQITVTRSNVGSSAALSVNVTSDRPGDVSFTSPVIIAAGQSSVSFTVSTINNSVLDLTRTVRFTATATDYVSGNADLEITDDDSARPWFNATDPLDVNGDGRVSSADALSIINYLRRYGSRNLTLPYSGDAIDTSGDDRVSPTDAVLVINALKRRAAGEAEGEWGPASAVAASTVASPDVDDVHDDVLTPAFLEDIAEARRKRSL